MTASSDDTDLLAVFQIQAAVARGRLTEALRRLADADAALRSLQTDQRQPLARATRSRIGAVRDDLDHLRRRIEKEARMRTGPS